MRPAGYITQLYEREGYAVVSVTKGETIAEPVDLLKLWHTAATDKEIDRICKETLTM